MSLEYKVTSTGPTFADAFTVFREGSALYDMSVAASRAMKDAGEALKKEGRANIRAGGLGSKFANAWRVNTYPGANKPSLDPAAYGKHNISYATIFEEGGVIRGRRGMLWLPLPTVPKVGRRIARPRDLTGVKLFSIKSNSGKPLLAAKIRSSAAAGRGSRIRGQVSLPALRAGTDATKIRNTAKSKGKAKGKVKAADASARVITVSLFHGVPAVTLRRRFNLSGVAKSVAARLPEFYERHAPKED